MEEAAIPRSELKKLLVKARRCPYREGFKVLYGVFKTPSGVQVVCEIVTAASFAPSANLVFQGYVPGDPFLSYEDLKEYIKAAADQEGVKVKFQ